MHTDEILDILEAMFPDAHCELIHKNPFELLVAVVLSAQTTDEAVNKVTPGLFAKFPTPEAMANASLEDIEACIKRIGLYRNKAKSVQALSKALVERFHSEVPHAHKDLTSLAGVGRKTANVVQSVCFDIPAIAVDTHVERISKRLGLAKVYDNVETVEKTLDMLIDEGWLCLFNDDGDIRIARGVNSLVTITSTETEDMQKIIIVESMNMIREDIYGEYKNNYVGKYKNHYDNQCLFISAVNGYFRQLQLAEILDPEYDNHSTIDVESQRQAWLDIGRTDAADWNVFLQGDIKILDATEDLKFDIGMQ